MKRRRERQKEERLSMPFWGENKFRILAVVYGAIAVAVIVLFVAQNNKNASSAHDSASVAGRTFDAQVYEVANKFMCSCGDCSDVLGACTCSTAMQEMTFIDEHLKRGVAQLDVVKFLNMQYGHIRPEFASLLTPSERQAAPTRAVPMPSAPPAMSR